MNSDGRIELKRLCSMPPPLPQQIRAPPDLGLIFHLNGGRALRGTLVAVVRSTLKQVGRDEEKVWRSRLGLLSHIPFGLALFYKCDRTRVIFSIIRKM